MLKKFTAIWFCLALYLVSPATLRAQGASPGAFDKVDGQFLTVETEIDRLQGDYILLAGRYLQTLPSADSTPDKDTVQNYLHSPSDVGVSLADLGASLPVDLALRFEIHEYLSPSGPGYRLIAYAIVDGQEYRRVTHRGPDPSHKSTDWEVYEPLVAP